LVPWIPVDMLEIPFILGKIFICSSVCGQLL